MKRILLLLTCILFCFQTNHAQTSGTFSGAFNSTNQSDTYSFLAAGDGKYIFTGSYTNTSSGWVTPTAFIGEFNNYNLGGNYETDGILDFESNCVNSGDTIGLIIQASGDHTYIINYQFIPTSYAADIEPNDIYSQAITSQENTNYEGWFNNAERPTGSDETDWYKFTSPRNGTLTITLNNGDGHNGSSVSPSLYTNSGAYVTPSSITDVDSTITLTFNDFNYSGDSFGIQLQSSCVSYQFSWTIESTDTETPIAIGQNITAFLNESGEAIVNPQDADNGSTDNVGIASFALDQSTFICDDLGDITTIFTVTDTSGNTDSVDVIVTVIDDLAPSLSTQNIIVELGVDGTVILDPFEPVSDTGDNCLLDIFLDNDFFTCDDVGDNQITVTAVDGSGNFTDAFAVITIVDAIDPVAVATITEITLELDENGMAELDSNIDGGSTDNCGIAFTEVVPNVFTCDDLGLTSASYEVFDDAFNMDTIGISVTVVDNLSPTVIGQNITIELVGGMATITPEDLDNGSYDNCSFTLAIDQDTFNTTGDYFVELTATDGSGHTDSTLVTVTVEDTLSNEELLFNATSVKLYPVPTKNMLHIVSPVIIDHFKIIDLKGRLIIETSSLINAIDVSAFAKGVYFIQLTSQNKQVTKRFVKH